MMRLIIEQDFDDKSTDVVVSENKETGEKEYYIEGLFTEADRVNRNGRIYATEMFTKEVQRYIDSHVKQKRAWGELDHPTSPSINMERVSHRIVEMKHSGNKFYGKALILDTPLGQTTKSLLKGGGKLGISSRGVGDLQESDTGTNVTNYILSTYDIVSDPSGHECFVNGIMEGVEWVYENGTLLNLNKNLKEATVEEVREAEAKTEQQLDNLKEAVEKRFDYQKVFEAFINGTLISIK